MPGANPVTPVISALFFRAGRCQGWREMPEKVEGSGQRRRWQQDTHGGGRRSQPLGGCCESSCLRGAVPGEAALCPLRAPPCWVGLVTLSCPQSSGGAWADPALPRSLLPSPPWSLLPQLRPQHFRTVHSLQSCPSRDWRCHLPPAPSAASAPWSQLPASPRTHVGGCS